MQFILICSDGSARTQKDPSSRASDAASTYIEADQEPSPEMWAKMETV